MNFTWPSAVVYLQKQIDRSMGQLVNAKDPVEIYRLQGQLAILKRMVTLPELLAEDAKAEYEAKRDAQG